MGSPADQIHTLPASDRSSLPYRFFPAEAERHRGSLVYVHGIQSHGGWYVETAEALALRGFAVYLPDRRGSGVSRQPRGWFRDRGQLVDDLRRFVDLARGEGDRPTFVVGGCWGARPAITYALESQDVLAGLVLVCPALKAKVDLTLPEKLEVVGAAAVRPRHPVRIPLEPELFTSNPRWLAYIRDDPLSLRHVTASFYFRQARWDRWLARQTGLMLPLLVLQSGRDEIVDVEGVRAWFTRQESTSKRFVLYPEFEHILDFEDERERYWDDLSGWLEEVAEVREREASRA